MRLLLVALAFALLAPTAAAQFPSTGTLIVRPDGPARMDEDVLRAGRLPPETDSTTVRVPLSVEFPPFGYCASSEVRMLYAVKAPPVAQITLLRREEVRSAPTTPVIAPGYNSPVTGFEAALDVRLWRNAPAFWTVPIEIDAVAYPTYVSPLCTATMSVPMKSFALIVADYVPQLELTVPAEPWTEEGFFLTAANLGNGDSKLGFAFESLQAGWVASPELHYLESAAVHGEKGAWKNDLYLSRLGAPDDWTGRVTVTMTAVQTGLDIMKDVQVVHLGPPPLVVATSSPEESMEPENYAPGWGGLGAVAALALAGLRRRFL